MKRVFTLAGSGLLNVSDQLSINLDSNLVKLVDKRRLLYVKN